MGEVRGWRGNCVLLKAVGLGTGSILVISSHFKTLLIHIFNISVITPVGEVRSVPFGVTLNIKQSAPAIRLTIHHTILCLNPRHGSGFSEYVVQETRENSLLEASGPE
jgi:hypothetical protein